LADRGRGDLFAAERAAVDQCPADRPIRMAVLVRIADPDEATVPQLKATRALDLEEERIDRIVRPADDRPGCRAGCAARRLAGAGLPAFGLRAAVVRDDPLAVQTAAQPQALESGLHVREVDRQQVRRPAAQGHLRRVLLRQATGQKRFVVAGHQAGRRDVVGQFASEEARRQPVADRRVVGQRRAETGPAVRRLGPAALLGQRGHDAVERVGGDAGQGVHRHRRGRGRRPFRRHRRPAGGEQPGPREQRQRDAAGASGAAGAGISGA